MFFYVLVLLADLTTASTRCLQARPSRAARPAIVGNYVQNTECKCHGFVAILTRCSWILDAFRLE